MIKQDELPGVPWAVSQAECHECGKEWVAVRQLGVEIHCPDCGSNEVFTGEEQ